MTSSSDPVEDICLIPLTWPGSGKSLREIASDAGYVGNPERFTRQEITKFLIPRPDLVNAWKGLSEDQRCSPAWVFNTDTGKGRVWLSPDGPDMTFDDIPEACAEFIVRFMDQFLSLSSHVVGPV